MNMLGKMLRTLLNMILWVFFYVFAVIFCFVVVINPGIFTLITVVLLAYETVSYWTA